MDKTKFRIIAYFRLFALVENLEATQEELTERVQAIIANGHTDTTQSLAHIIIYPPSTLDKIVVFRNPVV